MCVFPGGEFGIEQVERVYPAVQTLTGKNTEKTLSDVEPAAMFGGIMDFKASGKGWSLWRRERLIEGRNLMGVQVIHNQSDPERIWIMDGEQFLDLTCPVKCSSARKRGHMTPRSQRFAEQEDTGCAATDVLAVYLGAGTLPHGEEFPRIRQKLVRFSIHADHGNCRIIR